MSSLKFTSITPAHDWFYRHDAPPGGTDKPALYHVAVWAITEEGKVIGLVSAGVNTDGQGLHTPPPVPGCYLHRDQIIEEEKPLINKR